MKISYNWLQDYIVEKLPEPEVLAEKIIFGAFEVEETEKIGDDTVFDIKVLPDRAHDCLSHYGMAREICGLLGLQLKPLEFRIHESVSSDIRVSVQTDLCRRYIARKIFGVKIGPSPKWLVDRLESIGQRSINNVVDATNYIMFSIGQPMHAFDYDKMANGHMVIRNANEGETMTTLDGKELSLDPSIVVIADEVKALAVAGVKGGNAAEVTAETKTIVLEVANFDPVMVRKAAKKLNLQTDSAKRFENELTPHLAALGMHLITDLIVDVAGGQPEDSVDEYKNPVSQKTVVFSADYINKILGTEITPVEMVNILKQYGYVFGEESEVFTVTVPYERIDIIGPHDMVEEIGRAYGYDKIVPKLPVIDFVPAINETFAKICAVKNDLISKGFSEVQTYTFTKKGDFEVARGAVGKSALRTNLSDQLQRSFELNKLNADLLGNSETKIFEVGTVFPKIGEVIHVAMADKKGVVEMSLDEYVSKENISLDGEILPFIRGGAEALRGGGVGKEKFETWSEFPFISRDIAFWVPEGTPLDEISLFMHNASLGEDKRDFNVKMNHFDTFTKEGKTSHAFRFVFQSWERTLTNEEVDKVMENIYKKVQEKGWEVR